MAGLDGLASRRNEVGEWTAVVSISLVPRTATPIAWLPLASPVHSVLHFSEHFGVSSGAYYTRIHSFLSFSRQHPHSLADPNFCLQGQQR